MPKITYIGTPDDPQTHLVNEGGIDFVKGQPVTVSKDVAFGGVKWFDKFVDNPTFSVAPDKAPKAEVPPADEPPAE